MEDDGSAVRGNKGDESTDASGIQSPEQRHTVPASELSQAGHCVRSVSPQESHTELDSEVSDDTDQELDIEDDDDFTLNPQL